MPYKERPIQKRYWSIKEVAREVGDADYNIRFYESMIPALRPKKVIEGKAKGRLYTKTEVNKIREFYLLKNLGIKVSAIKKIWPHRKTILKNFRTAEILTYGSYPLN